MTCGELPHDFELIGETVRDICYRNAVGYFGIEPFSPQED
jgi:glucuronate isomerase